MTDKEENIIKDYCKFNNILTDNAFVIDNVILIKDDTYEKLLKVIPNLKLAQAYNRQFICTYKTDFFKINKFKIYNDKFGGISEICSMEYDLYLAKKIIKEYPEVNPIIFWSDRSYDTIYRNDEWDAMVEVKKYLQIYPYNYTKTEDEKKII